MSRAVRWLGNFCEGGIFVTVIYAIDVAFDLPARSWSDVWRAATVWISFVAAYVVAHVVVAFRAERQIPRATGAELDALVEHLGIRRKVETDDELRERARRSIGGAS